MKKKILLFMLAFCFIIPCTSFLTACGSHEHKFNEEWTINQTHHWHQCEKCEEKNGYEEHNWDNGVITVPATPNAEGVKLFVCEDCKTSKTESVEYVPVTTVSSEEWDSAFNYNEINNFKMNMSYGNSISQTESNQITEERIKSGNILYIGNANLFEYRYVKDLNYYSCKQSVGETIWTEREIDEKDYNNFYTSFLSLEGFYSEFIYNSELKAYETEGLPGASGIRAYFEDGKLVKMTCDSIGMVYNLVCVFEYNNIVLSLPIK